MTGRILLDGANPQTQTVAAVKALLAWRGRASDPLPEFVELNSNGSRCVLVLSNKKDCYYVTTAADCSCPAHNWHPGQRCKHQRKHFPEQQTAKPAAIKQPNAGSWHGANGPIIAPEETRAAKAAPSIPLYIDMHDTSRAEVAYFERKEAVEFLPIEA